MSERIACPECGGVLHLPRDLTAPWVACPRCGRQIRNPQAKDEEPTPGEGERTLSCPSCGKGVEDHWLCCPYCDGPLGEALAGGWPEPEMEARPGNTFRLGVQAFLIAFGVIGTSVALVSSLHALSHARPFPLLATLTVLFVPAVVSAVIVEVRGYERGSLLTLVRIALGALALAGGLVLGCCLLGAAIVFLGSVCPIS